MRVIVFCLTLLVAAAASAETQQQAQTQQAQPLAQQQQDIGRQADLQLYRLESVERRMESAEKSSERLLIAAVVLAMLMLAVVLTGAWRAYMRWHSEQLNLTARNARRLMRDIRTELERPQLSRLRVGFELRRIMRLLRKGAALNTRDARMLAECATNGDMPASLYLTARALLAEANGEWHQTAKWLEGLIADGIDDDIDVLLHLAHAHIKIAAAAEDETTREWHVQLSKRYYARFADVMPADYRDMPMPPEPQLPQPKTDKVAESLMAKVQHAPKEETPIQEAPPPPPPPAEAPKPPEKPVVESPPPQLAPQEQKVADVPKPQAQTADASLPKPQPSPQKPITESPPPPSPQKPVVASPPPKPQLAPQRENVANSSSPPPSLPKSPVVASLPVSKPQTPESSLPPKEKAAESPSPKPQLSLQKPVVAPPPPKPQLVQKEEKVAQPSSPPPQPSPKPVVAPPPPTTQQQPKANVETSPKPVVAPPPRGEDDIAPPVWFATAEEIAEADREKPDEFLKRASTGLRNAAKDGYMLMLNALRGGPLPLMPLVPILPPPAGIKGAQKTMWDALAEGNREMYRAALALSVRARSRCLAAAVKHYTMAQRHHTNEYLCHNTGLAHIAIAMHSPAEKRQAHFRMAAGMYAAGNAARPHYFDFSLAELYALAGDAEQCRKWLQQSAADKDDLRSPVFDNMRGHQWFSDIGG